MFKSQASLINYLNAVLSNYFSKILLFNLKNIKKTFVCGSVCVYLNVIFKYLKYWDRING